MRLLTENFLSKLMSLLGAFALWFAFIGESEVATSLPVIVQYRNVPQDLEIAADHPEHLFMKLRGPASRLGASELSRIGMVLDLGNVSQPGQQTFTITERELGLPSGVELQQVVPSQVSINFERRATRSLPVEVRFSGPPPEGYRIAGQSVAPHSVFITGPETRVSRLESVTTDAVNLSGKIGTAEFRVPIQLNDAQLRFDRGTSQATVKIRLEKIR